MKYSEVESWVTTNFLDVSVHTSSQGSDIGNKVTVDWQSRKNHASYLSGTIDEDKVHKIIMWDFDDEDLKVLALLHELGHHTEDQDGDVVYKEQMAWEGCFKWMNKLGLKLTNKLRNAVSDWFSTYLNAYGLTKDVSEWLLKHNIQYKPNSINTNISKGEPCINVVNFITPDTSLLTDFGFKGTFNKPTVADKIWGFESWKKRY